MNHLSFYLYLIKNLIKKHSNILLIPIKKISLLLFILLLSMTIVIYHLKQVNKEAIIKNVEITKFDNKFDDEDIDVFFEKYNFLAVDHEYNSYNFFSDYSYYKDDKIFMKNMFGNYKFESNRGIFLSSKDGIYNNLSKVIQLEGDVFIDYFDFLINGCSIKLDLCNRESVSPKPVLIFYNDKLSIYSKNYYMRHVKKENAKEINEEMDNDDYIIKLEDVIIKYNQR